MSLLSELGLPPAKASARIPAGASAGMSAVENAPPRLAALRLAPADTTIDGDARLRLVATGRGADGSELPISLALEWTVSPAGIVSVDADGLVSGHPVSGTATVTATDPHSGLSASTTVTVQRQPRLGPPAPPALQAIELLPARVSAHVADVLRLQAIGRYSDGSRKDLTTVVAWRSSAPAVAGFTGVTLPGAAYVFGEGRAAVHATDPGGTIVSAPVTITATRRPPPPAPPVWLEKIVLSPAPGARQDWQVGELKPFRATGRYSNRSEQDLTRRVAWESNAPAIVAIDAGGVARALKPGEATLVARSDGLLHGEAPSYFFVRVFGAAAKTPPVPPATGALSAAAAKAMVANLVQLADKRYMTDQPIDPGKLAPTGQPPLDRLLAMAAEVVKLWGGLATLLQARQIWQAVRPRLLALLAEAAAPKLGLTPQDLGPGQDAVNTMHAWISGPLEQRQIEQTYVRKLTPFGELMFPFWSREDVLAMLHDHDEARSDQPLTLQRLQQLEEKERRIQQRAGTQAALEKEIRARASKHAEQEAKDLRLATNQVKAVQLLLKSFAGRLADAKVQVDLAWRAYDAAELRQRAAEERQRAEAQSAAIDACLGVVKMLATLPVEGPAAVIETIDVVKDLRKVFDATDVLAGAQRMEASANRMAVALARDAAAQARVNVDEAQALLKEAGELVAAFEQDVEQFRAEAEQAYDANAQHFRFGDVEAALAFADPLGQALDRVALVAGRARDAAGRLSRQVDQFHRPRFEGGQKDILLALQKDAARLVALVEAAVERHEAAKARLRRTRAIAHQALLGSKDPRRKQAP